MELALYTRNRPESPAWQPSFFEYLDAGLKYGWMQLTWVSYYYGSDFSKMALDSKLHIFYELIYRFRAGTLTKNDVDYWRKNYPK
jgi:hypothetical protein